MKTPKITNIVFNDKQRFHLAYALGNNQMRTICGHVVKDYKFSTQAPFCTNCARFLPGFIEVSFNRLDGV
jgi:hypothetical protein